MLHDALMGCRPCPVHAVKLLSGYPGLSPTFYKRTGGVLNTCLLDRTVWGQCIILQPKTRIIRRGWLGSSASNCPASGFALSWERYRGIGAAAYFSAHAKEGADYTNSSGPQPGMARTERLLQVQRLQHAVRTTSKCTSSKPRQKNPRGRLWQATAAYWRCVLLLFHRWASRT